MNHLEERIKELESEVEWLENHIKLLNESHYEEVCEVKAELAITKQELKNKRLN